MPAWRALLAGLLVLGLGAGVAYVLLSDDAESPPVPTLATASTSSSEPPVTVTITLAPSSTTQPPSIVTSTALSTPPVVDAMQEALAAWGRFAVTGVMADLGDWFVVGGPQRRQLREEAAAIRANPPGEPAYEVTTANVFTVSVTSDDVVLRAEVFWAREGEETQELLWDIQMRFVDGEWRLSTVDEVESSSG